MSEVAEVRLWFLLQQILHDEEASRKLKPLKVSGSQMTDPAGLGRLLDVETRTDNDVIGAAQPSQDAGIPKSSLQKMLRSKIVCNESQNQVDDLLDDGWVIGVEYNDRSINGRDSVISKHQEETNSFFSNLEDETFEFLGEADADDDLFWSDLNEDLLTETHKSHWPSHNPLDTSRNEDELLDGARKGYQHSDDSFEGLEATWPCNANVLSEERELLGAS